jgi:hypothetical protein
MKKPGEAARRVSSGRISTPDGFDRPNSGTKQAGNGGIYNR